MSYPDKSASTIATFALGLIIGMTACFMGSYLFDRSASAALPRRESSHPHAFFLGVTVKFPSVADKERFKALFQPLAEFVKREEFSTISYELSESDREPTQVFILERYRDKQAYLEVHKHSKEFLSFRAKFQEMIDQGAVVDGHSYIESNYGFV